MLNISEKVRYRIVFYGIILLKLLLLGYFDSELSSILFQPFVKSFVSGELNPWQHFFINGLNIDSFPYHGLMLYLHAVPGLINEYIVFNEFLRNILFKLPLLLSDCLVFYIINRLYPQRLKMAFIVYFLNPIVLYAIYVHAQLDIIPTSLFLYAIFALNKDKLWLSSMMLGLALATKFHVLVAIPLLAFYVIKKYSITKSLLYGLFPFLIVVLLDLPFVFSDGFWEMVVFNSKQLLLYDAYYSVGSFRVLLPVLSIIAIYGHFFIQRKINSDLLNFYLASLYILLIAFILPSPAWYVWIVPFISVYFLQLKGHGKVYLMHIGFSFVYLLFFIVFYDGQYTGVSLAGVELDFKLQDKNLGNICYTGLEGTLLLILYLMYRHGINSNSIYRKETNLTLGIGGDSGVGKTTFLNNLSKILGERLLKLEGDGEHKWERGDVNWSRFTHLDPKANNIHKQAQSILDLKNNKVIFRSEYDHATGKFTGPVKVAPRDFIAISGLHPFYLPKLRKSIDLKIYMDTDEKLRRHWKIIRDTKYRGYSIDKIVSQIESRVEDSEKYIHPQKNFSDLTFKLFPESDFQLGSENADIKICLKVTLDASIHIEERLDNLDCPILMDYNDDLVTQYIIFKEEPQVDFNQLSHKTIPNVTEILGDGYVFLEGYDGFMQYITLLLISEKLKATDDV